MESNISIHDFCIACGHYHTPADWVKNPMKCTDIGSKDNEPCKCKQKDFVGRSFKRKW